MNYEKVSTACVSKWRRLAGVQCLGRIARIRTVTPCHPITQAVLTRKNGCWSDLFGRWSDAKGCRNDLFGRRNDSNGVFFAQTAVFLAQMGVFFVQTAVFLAQTAVFSFQRVIFSFQREFARVKCMVFRH